MLCWGEFLPLYWVNEWLLVASQLWALASHLITCAFHQVLSVTTNDVYICRLWGHQGVPQGAKSPFVAVWWNIYLQNMALLVTVIFYNSKRPCRMSRLSLMNTERQRVPTADHDLTMVLWVVLNMSVYGYYCCRLKRNRNSKRVSFSFSNKTSITAKAQATYSMGDGRHFIQS